MDTILQGYVTKVAAIILIAIGLIKVYQGQTEAGLGIITAGFGLFGLRRAVDNVQTNLEKKIDEAKKPCPETEQHRAG